MKISFFNKNYQQNKFNIIKKFVKFNLTMSCNKRRHHQITNIESKNNKSNQNNISKKVKQNLR